MILFYTYTDYSAALYFIYVGLQEGELYQHPLITLRQLCRTLARFLLLKAAIPRPERPVPNCQGFACLPHLCRLVIPELIFSLLIFITVQFLIIQAIIFLYPLGHGFLFCSSEVCCLLGFFGLLGSGKGGWTDISRGWLNSTTIIWRVFLMGAFSRQRYRTRRPWWSWSSSTSSSSSGHCNL